MKGCSLSCLECVPTYGLECSALTSLPYSTAAPTQTGVYRCLEATTRTCFLSSLLLSQQIY